MGTRRLVTIAWVRRLARLTTLGLRRLLDLLGSASGRDYFMHSFMLSLTVDCNIPSLFRLVVTLITFVP